MTTLTANISGLSANNASAAAFTATRAPSREMIVLGLILAALQIGDGVLTGVGVHHLGTGMEGNILLRLLMEQFGAMTTLVLVKTFAIGVVGVLTMLSTIVPWLTIAFRAMIALYSCLAIIPWTAIIYTHIL